MDAKIWPHKSRRAYHTLYRSDRPSPSRKEITTGTKPLHCRFDNPTSAVQENGKYGGRRQSRWLRTADGFAVFEAAFLCWPSLRGKSRCSQMHVRRDISRPVEHRPPYGQRAQNFGPDISTEGCRGPFCLHVVGAFSLVRSSWANIAIPMSAFDPKRTRNTR